MTEYFNEYLNKISQYLLAQNVQDEQDNSRRVFERLIIYRKIINNTPLDETLPIQEDLLRFGLISKRGGCLQITSRIHQECFDTNWVDKQLKENSIFKQVLYWAEEDKLLEDKLCDLILVEESNIETSVEDWVKGCLERSQLIQEWKNGNEVYHQNWKQVHNNILYIDEENRRLILEIYQNILQNNVVIAIKDEALLRLGLIAENGSNFKIAKNIYQLIFNETWVQTQLDKLPTRSSEEVLEAGRSKLSWWSKLKSKISRFLSQIKFYLGLSLLVCLLIIFFPKQPPEYVQQSLDAKGVKARNQFDDGGQLSSLVLATEYGQELKNLINNDLAETRYKKINLLFPLQYILENIYQKNEFIVKNIDPKNEVDENKTSFMTLGFMQDTPDALILVASTGEYGSIRLWNLSDPSKKLPIEPTVVEQGIITSISFNHENKFFATSGMKNKKIKFWDTSGKLIGEKNEIYQKGEITSIKFSPNGQILATVLSLGKNEGLVKLWQVEFNNKVDQGKIKLKEIRNLKGDRKIETLSFSLDGTLIATAEQGGTVRLWDISSKERETIIKERKIIIKDRQGGIKGVNFSPGCVNLSSGCVNLIATAGKDGTVMFWNFDGKPQLSTLKFKEKEERNINFISEPNVNFSPDGEFVAITGNTEIIQFWKLEDLQNNKTDDYSLKAHNHRVSSLIFSPEVDDKYYLATGGGGKEKTVRLWDLSKLKKEPYFKEEGLKIIGIGQAYDKRQRLLIFKKDGSVKLLKLDDSKVLIHLQDKLGKDIKAKSVDISPDKKKIITVDDNNIVQLWDFSGNLHKTISLQTNRKVKNIILGSDAYSQDQVEDYFVIIEDDSNASIWTFLDKKSTLYNENNRFNNAIFNPQDKIIATIDDTAKVKFWNLRGETWNSNLDKIPSNNGIKSMKFSPDGKFLAVVGEKQTINLWEIAVKQEKEKEKDNSMSISVNNKWDEENIVKVTTVEFSYNGELIATSGDDNLVKVWDLEGRQVAEFSGDWQKTVSLSFNVNTTTKNIKIYAAGDNGKVDEWEIKELDALLQESCDWLKDDYFKVYPENNYFNSFTDNKEKLCP
ncbi:WD40 repeat domain-containing protein [Nostoc sp. CCY 9925]|uniref:WD40 repeat domain-containing protein n=1 Tax=Nostoc sp. CCY 9925 TaxID=3103865 RepID=UPI0039C69CB7